MREIIIILIMAMNTFLIVSRPEVIFVESRESATRYLIKGIKGYVEERKGEFFVHGKIKEFKPHFPNIELKEASHD